jgi:hypothetical protein
MAGIKEWFGLRAAASDVQLRECAISLRIMKSIYSFLCPATAMLRRERQFAQLSFTSLQCLMCCHDVFWAALDVHQCTNMRMPQLYLFPGINLDEAES